MRADGEGEGGAEESAAVCELDVDADSVVVVHEVGGVRRARESSDVERAAQRRVRAPEVGVHRLARALRLCSEFVHAGGEHQHRVEEAAAGARPVRHVRHVALAKVRPIGHRQEVVALQPVVRQQRLNRVEAEVGKGELRVLARLQGKGEGDVDDGLGRQHLGQAQLLRKRCARQVHLCVLHKVLVGVVQHQLHAQRHLLRARQLHVHCQGKALLQPAVRRRRHRLCQRELPPRRHRRQQAPSLAVHVHFVGVVGAGPGLSAGVVEEVACLEGAGRRPAAVEQNARVARRRRPPLLHLYLLPRTPII
mmetsp:Transcript_4735/g.16650  ORF Transcript_4735/g.16650 Transcript_4735/m.16650 type:complete len:307 (-) Transcript_4735:124-1044(-)